MPFLFYLLRDQSYLDQPLVSQKYFSIDVIITLFKRIKKKLNLLVVHAF